MPKNDCDPSDEFRPNGRAKRSSGAGRVVPQPLDPRQMFEQLPAGQDALHQLPGALFDDIPDEVGFEVV